MKLLFIIAMISFYTHSYSQSKDTTKWSPEGAIWTYKKFSATSQHYSEYSYQKDTVISGIQSKQFLERAINFNGPNLETRTVQNIGYHYFHESNDSIFYLNNNQFEFIYSFTANINDIFILNQNPHSICQTSGFPQSDTVTVTAIEQDTLSNLIFDILIVDDVSSDYLIGDIIENIGLTHSFFPSLNPSECQDNGYNFFEGLVCYRDNIRGEVEINSGQLNMDCHTIRTSINEVEKANADIRVFPNPVKDILIIEAARANNLTYTIFDITGKGILKGKTDVNFLNVSSLETGVYLIFIQSEDLTSTHKFIKQ